MGFNKGRSVTGRKKQIPAGWQPERTFTPEHWDSVDAELIKEAIELAAAELDALLFGRTSDGGVMHLTWFYGDERLHKYPKSSDEAEEYLTQIVLTYKAAQNSSEGDSTQPPPNPPSRGKKRA